MLLGGWNCEMLGVWFKWNLVEFYVMLWNYGFKKWNIKMFYVNGVFNFYSKFVIVSFCYYFF